MDKYDVGIIGLWSGCNYGSIATYYALNQVVSSMGKSVLMIDKPILTENDAELKETHSRIFAKNHYNISGQYHLNELYKLNDQCDTFLIGSDQVWNYGISKNFGKCFYFDFVEESKKKIAYAVSFGHGTDFAPYEKRKEIAKLMSHFDGISTRESDGVRLCRDSYGIAATQVLDPVFLADPAIYTPLIEKSTHNEKEPFLATYILDPTPEKREAILHLAHELGDIKIVNMLDGLPWTFEKNKKLMDLPNCITNLLVEDWLYFISNCRYLITDSCHGASFGLIFKKDFVAITNRHRGISRFKSLSELFGCENRVVNDPHKILTDKSLLQHIDYSAIEEKMKSERKRCYAWLKDKLDQPKRSYDELVKQNVVFSPFDKEVEKLYSNIEFRKIRTLAEALYSYGIRHVVLSPGGRDVPLVRMFEYNDDKFIVHHVVDERSAAYYGLGLATQLKAPVVCVCTSGTAASNYLPAVTEAYYTGIPLIMITADRLSVYHEQGEDQTIPQSHIYDNVIKRSVTLPETAGSRSERQIIRDICDCILETTHHTPGPVHINIAIDNISIGSNLGRDAWSISKTPSFTKIQRVSSYEPFSYQMRWVNSLKRSKRILIVYGQNNPLDDEHRKYVEEFAKKYNCVILTDLISNYDGEYCLKPYNMLSAMSGEAFNKLLSPDILISVGGKRLMNDPLTTKIRRGLANVRHWSVNPDGRIKDFYFRQTTVLEMSQEYFFKFFSDNSGDIRNDEEYYNLWKKECSKYETPIENKYNSLFVQSFLLPSIPENSILHLGVGLSFYSTRRYELDRSVEVYCNMGTNGIDGCTSTFLGQAAVADRNKLCFLIVGDLSFFYDMNSLWDKKLTPNTRILLVNNNGSGLLKGHNLRNVTSVHNTKAKGWVESNGIKYISAGSKEEFTEKLKYFVSKDAGEALFFEVFCE